MLPMAVTVSLLVRLQYGYTMLLDVVTSTWRVLDPIDKNSRLYDGRYSRPILHQLQRQALQHAGCAAVYRVMPCSLAQLQLVS